MNNNLNKKTIENFIIDKIQKNDNSVIIKNDFDIYMNIDTISELFNIDKNQIINLINKAIEQEELVRKDICYSVEKEEGDFNKLEDYYNIQAITSISYKINSEEAIEFRKWVSSVLKSYSAQKFNLNKEITDKPSKEIRISEKNDYDRLRDIYATSIDYDPKPSSTRNFYSQMQNKMHYAITGATAAENIDYRADLTKRHMGLKTWKNSPDGKITKSDTKTAKNYLSKSELQDLEQLTSIFLDFAEYITKKNKQMTMSDWTKVLDDFLKLSNNNVLQHYGSINHKEAKEKAYEIYGEYKETNQKLEYLADYFLLEEDRLPSIEKRLVEIKQIYDNLSDKEQNNFFKSTNKVTFNDKSETVHNWIENNYLGIIELSDRNELAEWVCKSKKYLLNTKRQMPKKNQQKVKIDELKRLKNAIKTLEINDDKKLTSKDIKNINDEVIKSI